MNKNYKETYVIYGFVDGQIFSLGLNTFQELRDYILKNFDLTEEYVDDKLIFNESSRRREEIVKNVKDNALELYTELYGAYNPIKFNIGDKTVFTAVKYRLYNPFHDFLQEDEILYDIIDDHIQRNPNFKYYVTNTGRVFRYNLSNNEVIERSIDNNRVVIMGKNYSIKRLLELKAPYSSDYSKGRQFQKKIIGKLDK